jgi:hypothetical protein
MEFVNFEVLIFTLKKMKDLFLLDFFILSVMNLQSMSPQKF